MVLVLALLLVLVLMLLLVRRGSPTRLGARVAAIRSKTGPRILGFGFVARFVAQHRFHFHSRPS